MNLELDTLELVEIERRVIVIALKLCRVKLDAAKALGISPRGLHYKFKRFEIQPEEYAARAPRACLR